MVRRRREDPTAVRSDVVGWAYRAGPGDQLRPDSELLSTANLPVPPPPAPAVWATTLRWAAVGVTVLVWAWVSFTREGWVPFLSGVDLGVHEFGHLLFLWAPGLVMSLAGSGLQVAAPAALAGYFWWRGDRVATVLLTAWVGMSLHNVSVYVYDATRMVLPLFGDDGSGAGHDWRNILGELGWLAHTDSIAGGLRATAGLAFAAALASAGWFAWREQRPAGPRRGNAATEWAHLPRSLR